MVINKGFKIVELPVYDGNIAGEEKELISRSINYKGELAVLSVSSSNYIAYVNFTLNGVARGNHYHLKKKEYVYIGRGRVLGSFKKYDEEDITTVEIKEGSLITIEPLWTHAFKTIEEGFAIEFSPTKYEEMSNDTFKDIIL